MLKYCETNKNMMLDEIPIDDTKWRLHWFNTVIKQVEPVVIRFYNRYLEHNPNVDMAFEVVKNMSDAIARTEEPNIKFYKGKKNGSSTYSIKENLIRINLNNIEDEKEFTQTVIHEVTHWIMDKVFKEQFNSARDNHNSWFWIMFVEMMNWFGLEQRDVF